MTTNLQTLTDNFNAEYEGYGISATYSPAVPGLSEYIEVNIDGWDPAHAYSQEDLDKIIRVIQRAEERYYED